MIKIDIHERSCRGCRLCVDICPTEVLTFDTGEKKAKVKTAADCIACLSCTYLCPSGALAQEGHHMVKNFYRDLGCSRRVEKFL